MAKAKKLGRPSIVDWGKFKKAWPVMTDSAIAELAHCSITNVHLRRKKLIAEAQERGQTGRVYVCKLPKWSHKSKIGGMTA